MTNEQNSIAQSIIAIGQSRGENEKTLLAALETGWVESRFRNLNYGDRDSLGVMQQRPSQGWGSPAQVLDPVYAINAFYDAARRVNAGNLTAGQLAQRVQRSAFPERYDAAESTVIGFLTFGGQPGTSPVSFRPYWRWRLLRRLFRSLSTADPADRDRRHAEIWTLTRGGVDYRHAHCS